MSEYCEHEDAYWDTCPQLDAANQRIAALEAELAAERTARQEAQAREIALRDALVPFAQIYLDCGEGVVVVAIAVSKVLAARDALSQPSPAVRPPKE